MKKILGIVGSKRSSGNCEIMVKEISRQVPEPHQLQLLRLPDFDIRYCTGCYRCLIKDSGCVIKDDLSVVLEAIAEADALILAVPTYFMSAHSCLKVLLDRAISFYSMADSLWEKPAVGVGIAGIEGKEGSTLLDIERFLKSILAKNKQSEIIYGALPGEVMLNEKNREIASGLARNLFSQPSGRAGLCCPLCGGQTFRFFEGNKICSAIENDDASPACSVVAGEYGLCTAFKRADATTCSAFGLSAPFAHCSVIGGPAGGPRCRQP